MEYRAYILNENGRIDGYRQLECADDAEAKQKAAQLLDGRDIELWQHGRLVNTSTKANAPRRSPAVNTVP